MAKTKNNRLIYFTKTGITKSTNTLTLRCSLNGYETQENEIDIPDDAATLQISIILKQLLP